MCVCVCVCVRVCVYWDHGAGFTGLCLVECNADEDFIHSVVFMMGEQRDDPDSPCTSQPQSAISLPPSPSSSSVHCLMSKSTYTVCISMFMHTAPHSSEKGYTLFG